MASDTDTVGETSTEEARKPNRVAYAIIGVIVGVCAIGWAIITAYADGTPGIASEVVSWQASDRAVNVRFQVGKPKGQRIRCAIVAYDPNHGEVGHVVVAIPAGPAAVAERLKVPTSSRATAVEVKECRKDG